MRGTLDYSFIGVWCEGCVRSVRTCVYPDCKYGVWVCASVRSPVPPLIDTDKYCLTPPLVSPDRVWFV